MENEKKYLNFPVPMLRDLYTDSRTFYDNVFDAGIYLFSKALEGLSEEAKYKAALKGLAITQPDPKKAIKHAKSSLSQMPLNYPMTGIEKDMLFDFYKNHKSAFEKECLGAFLGIKSIIGKKPYCKTNKAFIHARMFGYVSTKEVPENLSEIEKKYQIRWHMDKVLLELQANWFLKLISDHQRGMYISFDLSLQELAIKSTEAKQISKIKHLKEQKQKAIEAAKLKVTTY